MLSALRSLGVADSPAPISEVLYLLWGDTERPLTKDIFGWEFTPRRLSESSRPWRASNLQWDLWDLWDLWDSWDSWDLCDLWGI